MSMTCRNHMGLKYAYKILVKVPEQERSFRSSNCKVKVKQSLYRPGQTLWFQAGWGSQISRQSALEGLKFVSPKHWPHLLPRKYCWYSFL